MGNNIITVRNLLLRHLIMNYSYSLAPRSINSMLQAPGGIL